MKALSNKKIEQYYFIKNGVVYNISKSNKTGDECAKYYKDLTIPSIKIDGTDYYFDCLIEDGDTYQGNKFMKTIHYGSPIYSGQNKADESVEFSEFYRRQCMYAIELAVKRYFSNDWQFFATHKNVLEVPAWFIKGNGHTVVPASCQFEINEANITAIKTPILQKTAFNAANSALNGWGYELATPAKPEDITVKKKEN